MVPLSLQPVGEGEVSAGVGVDVVLLCPLLFR